MAAARNGVLQLALCALAIYTAFLVWGLLQEKITSTVYHTGDPLDAFRVGERFEYGVLLNGVQALCSCVMAMAYLMYRRRGSTERGLLTRLGLDVLTPSGCDRALVARGKK